MEFVKKPTSISAATGTPVQPSTDAPLAGFPPGSVTQEAVIEWASLPGEMQKALIRASGLGREFASSVEQDGVTQMIDQNGVALSPAALSTRLGNSTLDSLYTSTMPRTKLRRIERAYEWAEHDDLLSALLEIKGDLAVLGFDLRCKEEEGGANELEPPVPLDVSPPDGKGPVLSPQETEALQEQLDFQLYLSRIQRKWDLDSVISDLFYDWFVSDSMILYWRVNVDQQTVDSPSSSNPDSKESLLPGVEDICALSPKDCEWCNDYGQNILLYHVPQSIRDLVLSLRKVRDFKPQELQAEIEKLHTQEGIPIRWILAILDGDDYIPLSNDDGDYWMIRTKKRKRAGLSDPSMKTIFLWLEMRKTLKEGDFAVSFMMKHFILHVTMGESIDNGPMAGQKHNWPTQPETDSMQGTVATATKTMRLVTNHTVKFNFIYPPEAMFADGKYGKPEKCMLNWGGMTAVLLTGDGATNSSGYIGTKRVVANIRKGRKEVGYLLTEFFDHKTIKPKFTTPLPQDSIVAAIFDENGLKEARQLLDELKFGVSEGFIDPPTAQKEMGRDGDSIRTSKLRAMADNRRTGVYTPMNPKPGQAIQDRAGVGGRPANVGTTQDANTLHQPVVMK